MTRPLPLVLVGILIIQVLLLMAPVTAHISSDAIGGTFTFADGSIFRGADGWGSDGVSYGSGMYLQQQQLISVASATDGPQTRNPASLAAPHGGTYANARFATTIKGSTTTISNPSPGLNVIASFGDCGCTPSSSSTQFNQAAQLAARELVQTAAWFVPSVGAIASVGCCAHNIWHGVNAIYNQNSHVTVPFDYFGGDASQSGQLLSSIATFHISSHNPNPASFTAEWKFETNALGTSHHFLSSAVRLHRNQLPLSGEALNQQPIAAQGSAYGFGLAGVERPLWTPSAT